jgi:hypothetical protein
LYGKLAQKQGYQGKMPKYHNIMWAGWITAATRALISDALGMAKGKAVMVLCDGVYSLVPLKGLPISEKLGEWTYEEEDTSIDVIGAGIYQLSDGTNVKPFTRGFDYDSGIDIPGIVKFWESRCEKGEVTTTFDIQRFVGMGLALMGGKWEEAWRTFTPITREVNPVIYTGTSKRMPTLPFKKNRTTSGAHFLYPWPNEDESKLSYRYAHGAYDVEENEAVFRATAECEV